MSAAIELRDVVHATGGFVLERLDLIVREGERVVLLGPSGAGKTTLLQILNGSVAPTRGSVRLFGQDPHRLRPAERRRLQRRVGLLHQDLRLVTALRVVHNVNAGQLGRWSCWRALASLVRSQGREEARRALERVGLAHKLDAATATLSGGEQQRVALARLLVQNPQLLLADEPVSALDPARAKDVMDLLRASCASGGRTLVVSCHTTAFARSHFERALGLRAGRVVFDCRTRELSDDSLRELYRFEAMARDDASGLGAVAAAPA